VSCAYINSNLKVCNAGRPLNNNLMWGSDPVHPLEEAYMGVAKYIMAGAVDLEGMRKSMLEDSEATTEAKRPGNTEASTPPPPPRGSGPTGYPALDSLSLLASLTPSSEAVASSEAVEATIPPSTTDVIVYSATLFSMCCCCFFSLLKKNVKT
jgi:hypothetical protein